MSDDEGTLMVKWAGCICICICPATPTGAGPGGVRPGDVTAPPMWYDGMLIPDDDRTAVDTVEGVERTEREGAYERDGSSCCCTCCCCMAA